MRKEKYDFLKKFLPLLLSVAIFILPFGGLKAFAYQGGLLQGKTGIEYGYSNGTSGLMTDNNLSTSGSVGSAGSSVSFTLSNAKNIGHLYLNASNVIDGKVYVYLYNSANSIVSSTIVHTNITDIDLNNISDVKKVLLVNDYNYGSLTVKEFDIYAASVPVVHTDISGLTSSQTTNSVSLSWTIPSNNTDFVSSKVYRDGVLKATVTNPTATYTDNSLNGGTYYNYKVTAVYSDGMETSGISKTVMTDKTHDEITNLNVDSKTFDTADLTWGIPNSPYLVGFKVYRNNSLIKTLDKTDSTFKDTDLTEDSTYTYKVTALYDDGAETNGLSKNIATPLDPVVKTVSKATAVAVSYKQVNLSWNLPSQTGFHHVNIYRDKKAKEQGFFESLFGTIVSAASTEIFETNGTYFNDLTVQPDSSYEYTLTTETTDGRLSDGVTVTADTPKEPTPVYKEDGTYTVSTNGDYVFKWTEPTSGTVKLYIDGKEYKTVSSSLKQIIIPKSDMKTNVWGDPSISAVPIAEFGTEGKEVALGGSTLLKNLTMPFQSTDLLTTAIGIIGLLAPILLLSLSIIYFKPLKRAIQKAIQNRRERSMKT